MPDETQNSSAVETVRQMWAAHREGRTDDMLAFVHPQVVWRPLTRPGLTQYSGHAGALTMLRDMRSALGEYRMDFDAMSELPDGSVLGVGRVVQMTEDGEVAGPRIETVFEIRDGLVAGVDSRLGSADETSPPDKPDDDAPPTRAGR